MIPPCRAYQGYILGPSNSRPEPKGPGLLVALVGLNKKKRKGFSRGGKRGSIGGQWEGVGDSVVPELERG